MQSRYESYMSIVLIVLIIVITGDTSYVLWKRVVCAAILVVAWMMALNGMLGREKVKNIGHIARTAWFICVSVYGFFYLESLVGEALYWWSR